MQPPSPQEAINRLITGYWNTQALYVAAKLGIADLLVNGPRSADDLARNSHAALRARNHYCFAVERSARGTHAKSSHR